MSLSSLYLTREKDNPECKHADCMRCKLCGTEYKWEGNRGSGTLHGHMQRQHRVEYAAFNSGSSASSVVSSSAAAATTNKRSGALASLSSGGSSAKKLDSTQRSIASVFAPQMNEELEEVTARFFATNHIAYNVASSDSFADFVAAVRQSTVAAPKRDALKRGIAVLEQKMRTKLWTLLKKSASPVSIAIDGWTNVKHTKVLNVVLMCDNRAYYWRSIANAVERSSGEWMRGVLEPVITQLVDGGVRVVGFVADNEAVNAKAFRLLQPTFPFLIRVPCAAHTLQLVVKQLMDDDRWAELRADVQHIIQLFFASQGGKEKRLQLQNLQTAKGCVQLLELVKPNTTRWNSEYYAYERLQQLGG